MRITKSPFFYLCFVLVCERLFLLPSEAEQQNKFHGAAHRSLRGFFEPQGFFIPDGPFFPFPPPVDFMAAHLEGQPSIGVKEKEVEKGGLYVIKHF